MDLQGNILLERAPTKRWISIIAVVIPAAAFAMLATWFIRAYVAPPTIAIPSPVMVASTSPQLPQIATPEPQPAPAPAPVASMAVPRTDTVAQISITPPAEPAAPPPVTVPMINSLSVAPPSAELPSAEPVQASSEPVTTGVAQTAPAEEPAANNVAINTDSVPLPRSKPHFSLARVIGPVPLPRPKPAEDLPPPDLPATDIHAIQ